MWTVLGQVISFWSLDRRIVFCIWSHCKPFVSYSCILDISVKILVMNATIIRQRLCCVVFSFTLLSIDKFIFYYSSSIWPVSYIDSKLSFSYFYFLSCLELLLGNSLGSLFMLDNCISSLRFVVSLYLNLSKHADSFLSLGKLAF